MDVHGCRDYAAPELDFVCFSFVCRNEGLSNATMYAWPMSGRSRGETIVFYRIFVPSSLLCSKSGPARPCLIVQSDDPTLEQCNKGNCCTKSDYRSCHYQFYSRNANVPASQRVDPAVRVFATSPFFDIAHLVKSLVSYVHETRNRTVPLWELKMQRNKGEKDFPQLTSFY